MNRAFELIDLHKTIVIKILIETYISKNKRTLRFQNPYKIITIFYFRKV